MPVSLFWTIQMQVKFCQLCIHWARPSSAAWGNPSLKTKGSLPGGCRSSCRFSGLKLNISEAGSSLVCGEVRQQAQALEHAQLAGATRPAIPGSFSYQGIRAWLILLTITYFKPRWLRYFYWLLCQLINSVVNSEKNVSCTKSRNVKRLV